MTMFVQIWPRPKMVNIFSHNHLLLKQSLMRLILVHNKGNKSLWVLWICFSIIWNHHHSTQPLQWQVSCEESKTFWQRSVDQIFDTLYNNVQSSPAIFMENTQWPSFIWQSMWIIDFFADAGFCGYLKKEFAAVKPTKVKLEFGGLPWFRLIYQHLPLWQNILPFHCNMWHPSWNYWMNFQTRATTTCPQHLSSIVRHWRQLSCIWGCIFV